jgi:hypothetical protein
MSTCCFCAARLLLIPPSWQVQRSVVCADVLTKSSMVCLSKAHPKFRSCDSALESRGRGPLPRFISSKQTVEPLLNTTSQRYLHVAIPIIASHHRAYSSFASEAMADRRGVRSSSRRITPAPQPPSKQNTPQSAARTRRRVTRSQSRDVEEIVPAPSTAKGNTSKATRESAERGVAPTSRSRSKQTVGG